MKIRFMVPLLFAILPWAECGAQAQTRTASTTLKVSARVDAVCSVKTEDLAFGAYTGAELDAQGIVKATCSPQTLYQIGLDQGTGGVAIANRKLAYLTYRLDYNVYTTSDHSKVWGNTSGNDTVGGTGTGLEVPHTVYGRMPASAALVQAGDYTDTINVRIYF